ncbi:MAG: DoxX family membrane protein [Actinobacteria bacterium]|nr:MAG: DoxX family membrane protein [Actinomycetota bacterium]
MGFAAVAFRFVLGTVFALAGLAKLPRRAQFEDAVRGYRLVPDRLAPPIARWLPVVELAAGALLLLGLGTAPVAALLAAFLVVFTGAVAINLARGRAIDCGCHGAGPSRTIGRPTLVRNVGLLAMAVVVTAEAPAAFALDSTLGLGSRQDVSSRNALGLLVAATVAVLSFSFAREALDLRRLTASYTRKSSGELG